MKFPAGTLPAAFPPILPSLPPRGPVSVATPRPRTAIAGPDLGGFPDSAVQISESGGDSREPNSFGYSAPDIEGNVFTDNTYTGPWSFVGFNQGDVVTWSQWSAGFEDWNGSDDSFPAQDADRRFMI